MTREHIFIAIVIGLVGVASRGAAAAPSDDAAVEAAAQADEGGEATTEGSEGAESEGELIRAAPVDGSGLPTGPSAEVEPVAEVEEMEPGKNHLRGSSFGVQNTVSALSFVPNQEPTYNPRFVTSFSLSPRWSFNDTYFAFVSFGFATELTRADWTNDRFFLGDLVLGGGATKIWTVPGPDISVSFNHSWRLPTSKASQGESLIAATQLSGKASRSFGILEGLSVSASGRLAKNFHEYTTGSGSQRILAPCYLGLDDRCTDSVIGDGGRNVTWSLGATVSGSLQILDWLSVSVGMGLKHAQLYGLPPVDERVSFTVEEPAVSRNYILGNLGVSAAPLDYLSCSLGMSTANQELAPDGTHRTPFVNRYTVFHLNLELGLDHFVRL